MKATHPSQFEKTMMLSPSRFIPIFLAVALLACQKQITLGSAEGYGGGDNDIAALENARLATVATIKSVRDREVFDPICEIPICIGLSCSALQTLTVEQRAFLVRALTDSSYVEGVLSVLEDITSIRISDQPVVLNGVEVDAVAELGGRKIVFSRARISKLSSKEIIALLVHEAMHVAPFPYDADGTLTDEESIFESGQPLFTTGRQLADLTGSCIELHEERQRMLGGLGVPPPSLAGRATVDLGSASEDRLEEIAALPVPTSTPVPPSASAPTPTPVPPSASAPTPTPVPPSASAPTPTPVPPSAPAPTSAPLPTAPTLPPPPAPVAGLPAGLSLPPLPSLPPGFPPPPPFPRR